MLLSGGHLVAGLAVGTVGLLIGLVHSGPVGAIVGGIVGIVIGVLLVSIVSSSP